MNAMSFQDQLRQRVTAGAVIGAVHVGLFLLLNAARPEFVQTFISPPLDVVFIAEQHRQPETWEPPAPEVVSTIVTPRQPEIVTVEVASALPDKAITVAPKQTLPSAVPAAAGDAPRLVSAVEYVRPPIPRYPQSSRRQHEQGVVVLRVLIDPTGHATSIEVHQSSGFLRLDHAAREAVEKAEFKPYVENGLVQAALVLIPIEFSLQSAAAQRS